MLFILLIIILFICCVVIITSVIKSFNEWNRPLGSYKSEIITKYKENKNDFTDLVSYIQSIDSEVAIERNEGTNYKSYKYGDGVNYSHL
jgi:predicted PurR-regulated permease PerM